MKNTNSTNILVRLLTANVRKYLTSQIRKCATPFKLNSIENATPSSGTFPLASYKEIPSPGKTVDVSRLHMLTANT